MRSPVGPVLILLGLATTVVLVLLLLQTVGLRDELERARDDVATLQMRVEAQEPGVTSAELRREIDELRDLIHEVTVAGGSDAGGDVGTPAGATATYADVVERLDQVLERINALDRRVDTICNSVPVC